MENILSKYYLHLFYSVKRIPVYSANISKLVRKHWNPVSFINGGYEVSSLFILSIFQLDGFSYCLKNMVKFTTNFQFQALNDTLIYDVQDSRTREDIRL